MMDCEMHEVVTDRSGKLHLQKRFDADIPTIKYIGVILA